MTLMGYAVAGLIVYTAGYPLFLGYTIWKNREIAIDYILWVLAIILRKFFIALTAVVFNKNSSFQMAACLLVMFVAYAAQVHVRPYMSPANFEDVLKAHVESSFTSAIHARLRANLATIETRGRKKVRKNLLNFEGRVDRAAVFGILTGWLFNYNTVEEIMLFAAVIVCLMGIMYQANELSSYYPESKDSVTAVVLIVIIGAIVYFFVVLVTEMVVLYNEADRAKQLARAAAVRRKERSSSEAGAKDTVGTKGRLVGEDGDINTGKLDTQMNPLFMSSGGASVNATSGGSAGLGEAIMAQRSPPPPELWVLIQQGYADMQKQVETLTSQLADAKRRSQMAEAGASSSSGGAGAGEDEVETTKSPLNAGRRKAQFAPRSATNEGAGAAGAGAAAAAASAASMRGMASFASIRKQAK